MNENERIGFIGAGTMAQTVGRCIIEKGVLLAKRIFVSAPSEKNLRSWKELGVNLSHNNLDVVMQSDIIFLAIKPQSLDQVLKKLSTHPKGWTSQSKLVVSLIAGLTCETLREKLNPVFLGNYRLIRISPNTSHKVGAGFTAICPDVNAPIEDVEAVQCLISVGGVYEIVPESLMDVVTALSGSGVAFVYQIIEALSDGAVKQGLSRAMSYRIAALTLLGASRMILDTNEHPASLKDKVCSPEGITIYGIHALEQGGLRASLMDAMEVICARSRELNEQLKGVP